MNETIVQFGRSGSLAGNWITPDAGTPDTAVILLNPGTDHRAGPNRLYPELAGAIARAGINCLRFDYSGMGDSLTPPDRRSGRDRRRSEGANEPRVSERRRTGDRRRGLPRQVVDCEAAVHMLQQRYGIRNVVLFGICSSADDALRSAYLIPEVRGLVMLDGFGWRTPRFYPEYYIPRLIRPRRWLNFLRRKLGMLDPQFWDLDESDFRHMPGKGEVYGVLPTLIERGTHLLAVYTGEEQEYYCYAEQFHDMIPDLEFGDLLELRYLPDADHTLAYLPGRKFFVEMLIGWLTENFRR